MAREVGFYWVKIKYDDDNEYWEIARWNDPGWALHSNPNGYLSAMLDQIIEVDERRIERTT
jgi:hypothetical protein